MLAARFAEGDTELSIKDVDTPNVGPDDVLIELRAAGFCGTDYNYLTGKLDPGNVPLTPGHEGSGVIRETGENVRSVDKSDRAIVHYIRSCGHCRPCMEGNDNRCRERRSIGFHVDGTFAEYVSVPSRSVQKLPESVPFELGSIMGCAVATAYHATEIGGVTPSDCVVVFGAGGVGLHAILWAQVRGARKILAVDVIDRQLEAATEYGADVTLNPEAVDVLEAIENGTNGWGADVAIECSGSPKAMRQAIEAVQADHGYESGTVVSVGVQPEPAEIGFNDLREGAFKISGDHTRAELDEIISIVSDGTVDLDASVTHHLPLEDINEAIRLIEDDSERVGRIVIDPT